MSADAVKQRFEREVSTLNAIAQAIANELAKSDLPALAVDFSAPTLQELRVDSFDQNETWFGEWRDHSGLLQGSISIHGNGQAYAQFDVLCPHPQKSRWYVEAVTAWGSSQQIKSELQLLPAVLD